MELDFSADLPDLDSVLPALVDFTIPVNEHPHPQPHHVAATSAVHLFTHPPPPPPHPPPPAPEHKQFFHLSPVTAESPQPSDSLELSLVSDESSLTPEVSPTPSVHHHPLPVHVPPPPAKRRTPQSNVSHTRRCRAKVNSKLQELLTVLPEAAQAAGRLHPDSTADEELDGAKHKAQILALTISRFHTLRARNSELEMRLAISSPHHMRRWVRSVVEGASTTAVTAGDKAVTKRRAPDMVRALKSFMALICTTRSWKYAELWEPECIPGGELQLRYKTGTFPRTLPYEEVARLKAFRACSRRFRFVPRSGVPGRVYLTKRPEWLPTLDDAVVFPRAPHAVAQRVEVTFAVPLIVNGDVKMVVEFYDTARRGYDPAVVNLANEIAGMFASAFDERAPRTLAVVTKRVNHT